MTEKYEVGAYDMQDSDMISTDYHTIIARCPHRRNEAGTWPRRVVAVLVVPRELRQGVG